MRVEGKLGAEEIKVGGACFAAGDQVITRINDQRQNIYNRERWRVAEVDRDAERLWLVGIDTRRRVCVDSDYLGRLRERDGGPAIEHAYAATTYQAQGATVDSAFVMADPSMDRQEFYVATSRTREETYLYATPEIQFDRDEYAPRSPLREGLEHIAEAAERNRAQASAHDEALRQELGQLPPDELVRRLHELRAEAGAEQRNQERHLRVEAEIDRHSEHLESYRSATHEVHPANEKSALQRLVAARAEREQLPEVGHDARAKMVVAEHVLAERSRAAATAARISPPDYIKAELGERPSDPAKSATWDRAVRGIEAYRVRNGVRDRHHALGREPKDRALQAEQRRARERLQTAQRQLGLKRQLERAIRRSMSLGIGR
jgi:hypothetical protein